jgi:hypothetical protein
MRRYKFFQGCDHRRPRVASGQPRSLPISLDVNEVLGGLSRITFQMGVSALPHDKMLRSIKLLGTRVALILRKELTTVSSH